MLWQSQITQTVITAYLIRRYFVVADGTFLIEGLFWELISR